MIIKEINRRIGNVIEFFSGIFDLNPIKNTAGDNSQKILLIVRLDAIGDYILFRNFFQAIKKSDQYRDYKIVLLGNRVFKNVAENLDSNYISSFIWVDINKLWLSISYRRSIIRSFNKIQIDTIFHPTYARRYYVDKLIKNIHAKIKVGVLGDLKNTIKPLKWLADKFYSALITIDDPYFEFYRNKLIVEKFISGPSGIEKPTIEIENSGKNKEKFVIIFPEASVKYKMWAEEKFASITSHIISQYHLKAVITGVDNEKGERIKSLCPAGMVKNFAGKTSLMELIDLISKSSLVVTNDTVTVHLATCLNIPIVCIFNGRFYGKFIPYPQEVFSKMAVVVPPVNNNNINDINVESVAKAIETLIN